MYLCIYTYMGTNVDMYVYAFYVVYVCSYVHVLVPVYKDVNKRM